MVLSRFGPARGMVWAGLVLLAIVLLRLPAPPSSDSARPWIERALSLQGLGTVESRGEGERHFMVALPLAAAQNVGFAISRIGGDDTGRGAWIRGHERFSRNILWLIWIAAAIAAATAAAALAPPAWKEWSLFGAGCAAVAISGTARLDTWLPASAFFLFALAARGMALRIMLLGAAFSFHPFALIGGIALLAGRRSDRIALLGALPVFLALDPARLGDPGIVPGRIVSSLARDGWPGIGDGGAFRLLGELWGPGPVCAAAALASLRCWRREPMARVLAGATILLWILPAILGARRPEALGFATAGGIAAGAWGLESLREGIGGRWRRLAPMVALAAAITVSAGAVRYFIARGERDASARLAGAAIASLLDAGARVAVDPHVPALADSVATFRLPSNAERPELWDYAYWPGWYGGFTHWALSARTRDAIAADPAGRPFGRALVSALDHHADRIGAYGGESGRPAVEVFRIRDEAPWVGPDVEEVWGSASVARPAADFLNDISAFLIETGRIENAIPLLRTALRWNDMDPRLWNNLGTALLLQREAVEAGRVFGEGLKRVPGAVELRYGLARAYLEAGVPGRAETELALVVSRRPGFAAAHYELARAAAAMNHWPLVVRSLETYLSIEPNPPDRAQIEEGLREARRRIEGGS